MQRGFLLSKPRRRQQALAVDNIDIQADCNPPPGRNEGGWGHLPASVLAQLAKILETLGIGNGVPHELRTLYRGTFAAIRRVNKHWYSCVNAGWSVLELQGPEECFSTLVPKFPQLRSLDIMHVDNRRLKDMWTWEIVERNPVILSQMHNLVDLALANLTETEILAICELPKLQRLLVLFPEDCSFECDLLFKKFQTRNLKDLGLHFAESVDDWALEGLGQMENLVNLVLVCDGNPRSLGIDSLSRLTNLRRLQLYGCLCGSSSHILDCISPLVGLRHLIISDCTVTDETLSSLETLTKLTTLKLQNTLQFDDSQINGAGLTALKSMGELKELCLSNSSIRGVEPLNIIGNLPSLEWLDLSSCHWITERELKELTNLTSLRTLDLKWCESLSHDCVNIFSHMEGVEVNFVDHIEEYIQYLI